MTDYLPLFVALVTGIITLIGTTITLVGGFFLYRRLNIANAVSQEEKNKKQVYENVDFGNEILNRLGGSLTPVLQENSNLKIKNHELQDQVEIERYEKIKALGREESALKQRQALLDDVDDLRDEVAKLRHDVAVSSEIISQANDVFNMNNIKFLPVISESLLIREKDKDGNK